MDILMAKGWTGIMTGTLLAGIGLLIALAVVIYFFIKRLEHEKTSEISFAFRKNKYWIMFLIRYLYVAGIILIICGAIIAFAIFGVSAAKNF